ncbi:MAG: leucine--tRNA ligase [Leptospiraceae bacterium]|nr:leucine--tRNA ligase [Leptospiraceae bacterium]
MSYPFAAVEARWQKYWAKDKTFATPQQPGGPKYYVLDMFPYPSGAGLHVGHPEGYTATDIMARYKRAQGFQVLHPMGWDSFGLPAERYAMQTGIHPEITTTQNINNFRRQLQSLGFSYDWDLEIATSKADYYKWTQWIFLKIYNTWYDPQAGRARPIDELPVPATIQQNLRQKADYINQHRLAYITEAPVNWCAELGTVLANEEVDEWVSKGYEVVRKPLKQWMLRITAYAERLLADLEGLDWPAGTLELQRNWIGRSDGARIDFRLAGHDETLTVFTTRPDTLFGATYMVLAPEHPLVSKISTDSQKKEVERYVQAASLRSERDRIGADASKEKTGVFTGANALHPITGALIPIWIADYVLLSYGTGAIMAVPAHDSRDFEFAKRFDLPIVQVVSPQKGVIHNEQKEAFSIDGFAVNSEFLDGLQTAEAKVKMIEHLQERGVGQSQVNYKLRDWLFSRQRYWGEPIPISFDAEGLYYDADPESLPLTLPQTEDFQPAESGESPLARLPDWMSHETEDGRHLRRESNTMPQWAGSCWYYLRFIDPANDAAMVDKKKESYWMSNGGVDLYVGGAEHAVLHLLYARFWHKVLFDLGYVSGPEPFKKLVHQGLIMGADNRKMSKSLGNVVNPDDVVAEHGADAFRLYEMFMGPLEQSKPWSEQGIEGIVRFLNRVWRLYTTNAENVELDGVDPQLLAEKDSTQMAATNRTIHATIKKVTADIEKLSFNTAISQMMIFVNEFLQTKQIGQFGARSFVQLLAPFAPHLAEELWSRLGETDSLSYAPWPRFDPALIVADEIEVVFQVNGKLRGKTLVAADITEEKLKTLAFADESVQRAMADKEPRKVIVVKKKLVNIVV